jgi:class 3 adenylate cyclase
MRAAHLAGERKLVTVLFADVVGSTALAERMDPEDWAAIMNHAFERPTSVIDRYDGTIARLMGDALLAFFGAPVTHEADPARAVQAGLDLLAAAEAFATEARASHGIELALRVGVNTGQVVLGHVGIDLKYEYTPMGDTVNVAARMQAAARPITVLITAETYDRVTGTFECLDRGARRVKGKADPVRTYEVRGRKARPSGTHTSPLAVRGSVRSISSVLVGREPELQALRGRLQLLRSGMGGVASIIGEPGLGKSRLVRELKADVSGVRLRWLEGQTSSFGQGISYLPFIQIIRDWVAIREYDGQTAAWTRLEQRVNSLFGE